MSMFEPDHIADNNDTEYLSEVLEHMDRRRDQQYRALEELMAEQQATRARGYLDASGVYHSEIEFVAEQGCRDDRLESVPDSKRAGLLGRRVCVWVDGEYHAYQQEMDMGVAINTPGHKDGVLVIDFNYWQVACPRFRKCEECPNK